MPATNQHSNEVIEISGLILAEAQALFRSPPENVLGRAGPFVLNQPAHLAFIKRAAEMPAEAGDIGGAAQQFRRLGAVVSDKSLGMASVKEGITGDERSHLRLISLSTEIAARQVGARRPRLALFANRRTDLFQRMFCQPPIGSELAAENIEEWSLTRCLFNLQHIIARRLLRFRCTVIKKRANAGIGPDDIFRPDRFAEIVAGRVAEIGNLLLGDANPGRIALVIAVRGSDQREIALIGNGEDDAVIRVLEEIGARVGKLLAHDDMAALNEPDIVHVVAAEDAGKHLVHPGAGGIHQHTRLVRGRASGFFVQRLDEPQLAFAPCGNDPRAVHDRRAAIGRIARVEDHETGIIHPAVGIFESRGESRLQRLARRVPAKVERAGRRQKPAAAEIVIKKQAEPDHPCRAHAAFLNGQNETHGPDDMRRHGPEDFPLHQRFAHQTKLVMLEITQATMNKLGGGGRRAGSEIALFRKRDGIAPAHRIAGNAAAVDAATDDKKIENILAGHRASTTASGDRTPIVERQLP